MSFKIVKKQFDVVIIGSGGSGLMSALSCIDSGVKNIAIISKVLPTNSHTVSAKGGINAALGNLEKDDWKWHAFDTIKGSDYLADVDAVEILCKNAASAIIDLEKMGVVFSRNDSGKIEQRAYGGQTVDFGKGGVAKRACYSKDKTGHAILHSLHEQALKKGVKFLSEFFVTDLLLESGKSCHGCLAIDVNSGELVVFESDLVILATGGYSQIYQNTTSSLICTGDGSALCFKEGLPLQDMEFVQFHPTGIFGNGFLITEAARGEGAYLLNGDGNRFMKDYAPKMMELASRDVISQAMATEIYEGRGSGENKDFLHLDLRHISEDVLQNKLPGVVELVNNFAQKSNGRKLDLKKDLIPVSTSAHYTMGGIATNLECMVVDNQEKEISGLMAIGEAACTSVHGANRLGCNSLLDLIVFGKISGQKAAQIVLNNGNKVADKNSFDRMVEGKIADLRKILNREQSNENSVKNIFHLRSELQKANEKNLGVFRNKNLLEGHLENLRRISEEFEKVTLRNKSLAWNDELVSYLEFENLLLNSWATAFAALNREESRGAHYRSDFKKRDDEKFFHHSLVRYKNICEKIKQNELEFSARRVRVVCEIKELNPIPEIRKY